MSGRLWRQEPSRRNPAQRHRVGIVAKSLGNGFFDAVHKGADEAGKELDAEVIFTGPTTPTAEGQIEVLNSLIAQRVDAIAVSANDPDALVPTLKRAMERGIKVISYDSAVDAAGRIAHLAPSSDQLIGETVVALAAELAPMRKGQGQVRGRFGDADLHQSKLLARRDAQGAAAASGPRIRQRRLWRRRLRQVVSRDRALLKQHPDLAVLVSISSVGIVAAARAVEDQGLTGKVKVTGLGLPSELVGYVEKGVVPKFAIWNPIDLGYATTQIATRLARGDDPAQAGLHGAHGRGDVRCRRRRRDEQAIHLRHQQRRRNSRRSSDDRRRSDPCIIPS